MTKKLTIDNMMFKNLIELHLVHIWNHYEIGGVTAPLCDFVKLTSYSIKHTLKHIIEQSLLHCNTLATRLVIL